MLRRLSIRSKLLAILLLGGIACTAATGLVADRSGSQSLGASIFGQLTTLRESKKSEVERYFAELERQFVVLSRAPATIDAMVAFTSGYKTLQGEHEPPPELLSFYEKDYLPKIESLVEGELSAASYMPTDPLALRLQTDYIARNSFPVDEKQKLLSAGTGTSYDIAHERYHPFLTRAAEASNLSDIMLVDAQTGTVVYTIYKGIDFGSNVVDGPLAQSGIGRAFASALRDGTSDGSVVLEDFRAYPPSLLAPAAFIAVPIIRDGQTLGILIAEVSKDDLDAVMTSNGRWADVGLGKTGEAFLVGPDHRMRSGSRFQRETPDSYFAALSRVGISDADIERIRRFNSAVLNQPDNSRAAEEALRGQSGTDILQDYRGVDVLASWAPIDVLGTRWAILAKRMSRRRSRLSASSGGAWSRSRRPPPPSSPLSHFLRQVHSPGQSVKCWPESIDSPPVTRRHEFPSTAATNSANSVARSIPWPTRLPHAATRSPRRPASMKRSCATSFPKSSPSGSKWARNRWPRSSRTSRSR
ncbi:cache domain-containing protein [Mesorhizobium sp. M1E.F.Ca.ET.045.02.1.1]|uniref:cache domain-containing protein n=1 Tax=Mesorhizobium sp. M1E.F.Ca.ET.045.02.1.1 TaxID=2493672 RepID=UPI001FE240D6|nr:cache domain-containing protein [Mesorhizobium sp. M1E.F.Ca.ET.045.02.1.1]